MTAASAMATGCVPGPLDRQIAAAAGPDLLTFLD